MFFSHTTKSYFFKLLDNFPARIGFLIYHKLQKIFNNYSFDREINAAENTFNTINDLVSKNGISLEDKIVIEIGSGWLPLMPYFMLYRGGVKKVYTYDLNKLYNKVNIRHLNTLFHERTGIAVIGSKEKNYFLPSGVSYHPRTNLIYTQLENADLIFSRYVLEHVTPEDIYLIHKKFKNDLKQGTIVVHIISPGDHRAHGDKSLSLQDFLRYSKEEWNNLQTKFDYHNRLRLPEYVQIFKSLGFDILSLDYELPKKDSPAFNKFKEVPIHKDFQNFNEKELMAGNIKIALKI